jgi:hypothetical protein
MKSGRIYQPGDRVELKTFRGSERSAPVVMADALGCVVQLDVAPPGSCSTCWSWELLPLPIEADRGLPAWEPRPVVPRRRGRLRRGGRGMRRRSRV